MHSNDTTLTGCTRIRWCPTCAGDGEVRDDANADGDVEYYDGIPSIVDCTPKMPCPDCYCAGCGDCTGEQPVTLHDGDDPLCVSCAAACLATAERCDKCGRYEDRANIHVHDNLDSQWCTSCVESYQAAEDYYSDLGNHYASSEDL